MGRATKWLKSLFIFKKDIINEAPNVAGICHNPTTIPPNLSLTEAAWLRSYYIETEKEQSKHAIAVAAATAAAADAAIVAANAAVAVIKLTANGRRRNITNESVSAVLKSCKERNGVVRIQSVFRGYLARKALRALKSLVKIQAVVRGFLVRKQATAMLQSMQALVKAQANVLSRRVGIRHTRFRGEFSTRNLLDKLEIQSEHSRRYSSTMESTMNERAKIVEIDTSERLRTRPKSRSRRNSLSIYESITKDHTYNFSTHLSPFTHNSDSGLNAGEFKYTSSTQNTPKHSTKRSSEWTLDNPNYMANTQSFRAKLRSHSAPRQRSSNGAEVNKRMSLLEIMEARKSMSKTSSSSVSFKNVVMRKIEGFGG